MSVRSMFGPKWTVSPTFIGNEYHLFDSRGKDVLTAYTQTRKEQDDE